MAVLKLSSVLGGFAEKFALKGITKFEVEPRRLLPQKLETTSTSLIHTLVYKYMYIQQYMLYIVYISSNLRGCCCQSHRLASRLRRRLRHVVLQCSYNSLQKEEETLLKLSFFYFPSKFYYQGTKVGRSSSSSSAILSGLQHIHTASTTARLLLSEKNFFFLPSFLSSKLEELFLKASDHTTTAHTML